MPNRNVESHFSLQPHININRSRMDKSERALTSFNIGELVPVGLWEVLPGDTFDITTSKVLRMPALITPMFDSIYVDTYWFFVPNRLVWNHWKNLMGENTESAWIPETEYSVPQITAPSGGWQEGTIADKFGLPLDVDNISVSALPFRALALICNEWFRDENLTDPLVVPTNDTNIVGSNGSDYVTDVAKGGMPFKVSKYHDYFTSALPSPQKGPDVTIPVATVGDLPVVTKGEAHEAGGYVLSGNFNVRGSGSTADVVKNVGWSSWNTDQSSVSSFSFANTTSPMYLSNDRYLGASSASAGSRLGGFEPTNLWALQNSAGTAATINQLRMAFQIQKLFERDARAGSRYTEVIRSHFSIVSPDARLQRPEYLGGNRKPVTISQIVQSSGTVSDSTPQGTVAGFSLTVDTHSDVHKSFTEHGYIMCLMCARYDHTYQQGIQRLWSRKKRFDFYWPALANIGEQAILNKEIYAQGSSADDEVFGYQEAWAEYRYGYNKITGMLRSNVTGSLDVWHLGDDYSDLPSLSDEWIREDKTNVDRVLTVTSQNTDQIYGDIYFDIKATRPMPIYSIPGLIDHN